MTANLLFTQLSNINMNRMFYGKSIKYVGGSRHTFLHTTKHILIIKWKEPLH